jgi:hypothetical protein
MYGNQFYNETTRRYVAVFGTLFNDISIQRNNATGSVSKTLKVPINYAPMQKVLARIDQDLELDAPAMTLPRMSFEITGMNYAPDRKLPRMNKLRKTDAETNSSQAIAYNPAPYDISFDLNIMTKLNEDGTKILEQIIPFFTPDVTHSVKILDDMDLYLDIPIILNSVSFEDVYEGDFESRRSLIWTLSFTMKAYYFGPVSTKKVIKFSTANAFPADNSLVATEGESVTVQPGLKSDGTPANTVENSIPVDDISSDDDWAAIATIEDIPDEQ